MPIPESQLDTWSHQGSVTGSAGTYQTIRKALLAPDSGYADKSFDVFLQGSYGNDTNIYSESDVDVVICLESSFRYDLTNLQPIEAQAYRSYVTPATYSYEQFKAAVILQLQKTFGAVNISVGEKAIKIKSTPTRRSADVVVCWEYRSFKSFSLQNPNDYAPGIIFTTPRGEIINYPKQHSANLSAKHQDTQSMLKPMVRILKNIRSRMVDQGYLEKGVAPSYYLEGLFYNVPVEQYVVGSYGDTFCNGLNWLSKTDKSKLVCANWRYYLLGTSNVQWNEADLNTFLDAACKLWREY